MTKIVHLKLVFWASGAILSMACCQKPTTTSQQAPQPTEQIKMHSHQTESVHEGEEVFFILHSQEIKPASAKLPDRFYVRGSYEGGRFVAKSSVLGIGTLATDGRYGWLELNSKQFFPMESAQKANTPFVKGYITDLGFVPSERTVADAP